MLEKECKFIKYIDNPLYFFRDATNFPEDNKNKELKIPQELSITKQTALDKQYNFQFIATRKNNDNKNE